MCRKVLSHLSKLTKNSLACHADAQQTTIIHVRSAMLQYMYIYIHAD